MILSFQSLVACYVRRNPFPPGGSAGPGALAAASDLRPHHNNVEDCRYSKSKSTKSESSLCLLLAGLSSSSLLPAEVSLVPLPPGLAAPPLLLELATDVLGALLADILEVLLLAGALGGSDACG